MSVKTQDAKRIANSLTWVANQTKLYDDTTHRNIHAYATRAAEIVNALVAERDSLLVQLEHAQRQG